MKKILPYFMALTIFLSFVSAIGAEAAPEAQSESKIEELDSSQTRRNAMSLELLGRGLLYSFNYDYLVKENLGLGIGVSSYSFSAGNSSASAWIIPIYANYYFTEGKHRWFGSGGANVILASGSNIDGESRVSGSGLAGVLGGGYEFRANNGFLFRAAPYIFVGKSSGAWLGFSFGYTI